MGMIVLFDLNAMRPIQSLQRPAGGLPGLLLSPPVKLR